MSKIRLSLESLSVESFSTVPREASTGTVHANQLGTIHTVCGGTCDDTCIQTCANTCLNTCGTCNATCVNTCGASCLDYTCACGGGYVSQAPYFYSCRCLP